MKTLFFAFTLHAPWPLDLPKGRIVEEQERHLTLCFVGNSDADLTAFPPPPFSFGPVGRFNQCLFLPEKNPRVVAWNMEWFSKPPIFEYRSLLLKWLSINDIQAKDSREFLAHVTLARSPFNQEEWLKSFSPLPFYICAVHLFESLGYSHYRSLAHYPFTAPFIEIEHTADRAFIIQGEDLPMLYLHATIALAFHFPQLLDFFTVPEKLNSLETIVQGLNHLIFCADKEVGSPYKAVSHHGKIGEKNGLLTWEMIVDV